MITEIKYSNTNTYLISGKNGDLLFDTGWAGTFVAFCKALGEKDMKLQNIKYLLISHFHPDHMGIAQEIADTGTVIAVMDVQTGFIHSSDHIFEREKHSDFVPVDDLKIKIIPIQKSRKFLKELGISGEIIHTSGHTDDSISLWLDKEKALLVGDLNPLYELEMHKGTQIAESWEKLLKLKPHKIYYGHAEAAEFNGSVLKETGASDSDIHALVKKIIRLIDRGCTAEVIEKKTGADKVFIQDVARMYLTHQNVSVQGILDRIEIKGK
ncbi:MAG: MBL fold metallo-hydrolase [Oscillospiraceae bacterium]|nr:MBL fold metallo-hydrolase [Oscillospiraceae bacterium]